MSHITLCHLVSHPSWPLRPGVRPEMWMDYPSRPLCVFKHCMTGTQSELETLRWVSRTLSVTFSAPITSRETSSVINTAISLECLHSFFPSGPVCILCGSGVTNDGCEVTVATFYSLEEISKTLTCLIKHAHVECVILGSLELPFLALNSQNIACMYVKYLQWSILESWQQNTCLKNVCLKSWPQRITSFA